MADYHSWLVTETSFEVRDPKRFKKELEEVGARNARGSDYYGLCYCQHDDGSFWLGGYDADLAVYVPTSNEGSSSVEVDVAEIVKEHIRKGETAVFKAIGQEKLRYVAGYVVLVTSYGIESRSLDGMIRKLKKEMTPLKQGVKNAQSNSSP